MGANFSMSRSYRGRTGRGSFLLPSQSWIGLILTSLRNQMYQPIRCWKLFYDKRADKFVKDSSDWGWERKKLFDFTWSWKTRRPVSDKTINLTRKLLLFSPTNLRLMQLGLLHWYIRIYFFLNYNVNFVRDSVMRLRIIYVKYKTHIFQWNGTFSSSTDLLNSNWIVKAKFRDRS